jgi:hypothetical protein
MFEDDDFNSSTQHAVVPHRHQHQQQRRAHNWTRQMPDSDLVAPSASPGATPAQSNMFDVKQAGLQQHHVQPRANGLLHQAILMQHRTSMGKARSSSSSSSSSSTSSGGGMNSTSINVPGGLPRSASFDNGVKQSTDKIGPIIRWNFRDSPRFGLRRTSSLSISSVLSDTSNDGAMRLTSPGLGGGITGGGMSMFGGCGPSPSPLLAGSLVPPMDEYSGSPTTIRPNTPIGGVPLPNMLCKEDARSWSSLRGTSSKNAASPLSFSPVLSTAFGNTPAPSESSSIDEDFEL